MNRTGRPKQFIWRIIAFDILQSITGEDVRVSPKALLEREELSIIHQPILSKSFREVLQELDINITMSFKDEKQKEIFESKLLELDKCDGETWDYWMKRKQYKTLPDRTIDVKERFA